MHIRHHKLDLLRIARETIATRDTKPFGGTDRRSREDVRA